MTEGTRASARSRPRLSVLVASFVLSGLSMLGLCAGARGDVFEAISLASADGRQQADRAGDAAISADARFVAFDGSFRGTSGVFRRDLLTGEVATVAEGDAALPSISADGRYVSFTTTARLDEQNDSNGAPDVYVRDMSNPDSRPCAAARDEATEPCAFALASAVNGARAGLSYSYPSPGLEEARYGSTATGRSALSADGRTVAFVTTAVSNLANPDRPAPPPEPPETPPLQVAVRHLDTQTTELVSVLWEGGHIALSETGQTQPVPATSISGALYGAAYPGGARLPFPSPYGGASISADASTVAWMGQQIAKQAPVLPAEPGMTVDATTYAEPLWRRIAEGLQAPTRRVTGGGDPASAACAGSGEVAPVEPPTLSDPCQGPFDTTKAEGSGGGVWSLSPSVGNYVPQLSADGRTLAFIANAPIVESGQFGKTSDFTDDLYVVDMGDGLTRARALRRLTEVAGANSAEPERVGPIVDLSVSPDGSEIAFSTQRTVFPLGSPNFVSAPAAVAGAQELFDVDLANDTLTRVTQGYEGGRSEPANALTGAPSFAGDGNTLAFASSAYNLVYGDGNGASDVFVVARKRFGAEPVQQLISPPPAGPALLPDWVLGIVARSRRDGSVALEVHVPGAGSLRAGARATVRARCSGRGHSSCPPVAGAIVTRTVAARSQSARDAGLVVMTLRLSAPYASLAHRRGGLYARVSLSFRAAGHPQLRRRIGVTFRRSSERRARR
jgi:Tol biopolymer transport system component